MSGLEVVKLILRDAAKANIIMCTSIPEDIMDEALALGVRAVVAKPFDLDDLIRLISDVLIRDRCS